MNSIFWIIAIILGLCAAVTLVSAAVASVRAAKFPMLLVSLGLMLILGAVALYTRSSLAICAASVLTGLAAFRIVGSASRNRADASRITKLSGAHLALLAGSFIFLVPFAWFISSSLKPDDEQAVFPPVWIPTQQITSEAVKTHDGEPAGLSWYLKDSPQAKQVAEVADLPSGEIMVKALASNQDDARSVAATGPEFQVKHEELTKIRHVAPRWKNYSEALAFLPAETHYGLTFLGNTLYLTLMSVIGTIFSSSLVAYSFARLKWPGRNLLFVVLLATMMIPGAVTMMPQFLIFRSLGWIDTLKPLWVPAFFGSAFNIFLLRQFFMSIPTELEDAAKIDGCGPFGIYWRIMLPQVKPALAAIGILGVMGAWNNFQGPLIYLSSPEKMTLAYALQLYQQQHGGEPGLLMAASTLVVLPIIVLFFFTQRYFIEGVSLSGLGGR
ncbi:multiple sugar transport system permease protein [Abditibacterium utsteinense]|uniref:Multiple sugar transport system permease protein n=1 Tax=Abditibacterium utsteinense TaxID=1960156 RepID=A0A2S8SRR9_9BACT|nr:carbohydrate ABC transporter permease [Abditibacterium utsteinense]PQV63512.1 multiple sugar transport system permease protein [Abditibacterium utsteinense]